MERNANYALVGLASTILVIGLLIFIVWLTGASWSKPYDFYDIIFRGPVHGLTKGGEVDFNGIKVGDVTTVALQKRDPRNVIARVRISTDVPVRQDSYATMEPQGITGVNYVQITAGTATKPLLKDTVPEGVVPVLHSQRDALSDLLANGGTVLQRAVEALDRVNRIMDDENIAKISATLSDVQAVTAELRERKSIFADAQKTLQSAQEAAVQIRDLAKSSQGLVQTDAKQTVVKIGDAATELQATSKALHVMIAKLQDPTADFATTGLPHLTQTMTSLQRTSDDLDRLLNEIQASPRGLIAKPPGKEVEVKP
jgi:phospholipid/cholesterol/gamma-HCH transport system substrate-binding protein